MDALDPRDAPGPGFAGRTGRTKRSKERPLRIAWALFLVLGLPFALMSVLTTLARAGIYVELFRPVWQPWPPEILKPFIGVAGFAATLAYLAYRIGRRSGFHAGTVAGVASGRNWAKARETPSGSEVVPPALAPAENAPAPPSPAVDPPAEPRPAPPPPVDAPSSREGAGG